MASFSNNQLLFASAFARASGLNPRTILAWMAAEEPIGAKSGYGGTQDWLNVGITDSGPVGLSAKAWRDPVKAGTFSAQWMKGAVSLPGFGRAVPDIRAIANTVGKSARAQLTAIANSSWATSHYGGASNLIGLLGTVGNPRLPPTSAPGQRRMSPDIATGGPTINLPAITTDSNMGLGNLYTTLGGLEAARQVVQGDTTGTPDVIQQGWDTLGSLIAPNSTQLAPAVTVSSVRNNLGNPDTGQGQLAKGDLNPLKGWTITQTDMGVDASGNVGQAIVAPNASRVVHIFPNWTPTLYPNQPYVLLKFVSGPNKGRYYYVAEQLDNLPHVGQYIPRGGTIATYASQGTGIEMGWGTPGWRTLAQAQDTPAQIAARHTAGTPQGRSFRHTFNINLAANNSLKPVNGVTPPVQNSTPTTPLPVASHAKPPTFHDLAPDSSVNPTIPTPPQLKVPGVGTPPPLDEFKVPRVAGLR